MPPRKRDETRLVNQILEALNDTPGCQAWRHNTGRASYDGGVHRVPYGLGVGGADIVGLYRGRFFGIECKVGRNGQTPAQKAWERAVTLAGGVYVLARTVDEGLVGVAVGCAMPDPGAGPCRCDDCRSVAPCKAAAGPIVLAGWTCPSCRAFNGEEKERLAACRSCGARRP